MVGLVIVSHSARLAEGVAELAREVGGPELPLRATGGVDAPGRPLGTDAALVQRAIEEVWSDEGVLVLMDLGSALLSAELALELLPPGRRERVLLCDAPVVEGAVAAAVQARLGGSLEALAAEARGALAAKAAQLGPAPPPAGAAAAAPAPAEVPTGDVRVLRLAVRNRLGLHARPAARLVRVLGGLRAEVRLENLTVRRGPVDGRSLNGVATLGARQGHELQATATGPQADAALDALRALAEAGFGDLDDGGASPPPPAPAEAGGAAPGWLQGLAASPGLALGPVRRLRGAAPPIPSGPPGPPEVEWAALSAALERARAQLRAARDATARRAGPDAAALLDAHLLSLEDEALVGPARAALADRRLGAAAAWAESVERVAAAYRGLDDPYQRGRAADVEDVGRQVLRALLGETPAPDDGAAPPGVLVAEELGPAETARLDPARTLGLVTAGGAPTSHAAILARGLGIPAVVGVGARLLALEEGTPLLVDGGAGRVRPRPPPELAAEYAREAEASRRALEEARAAAAGPAITRDGRRVEVAANVGSAAEARAAAAAGADGVGLFRTEILFLDRRTAPGEEDQVAAYRAVAGALGGRPMVVRTLDAGGDKPLPYLDLPAEANPFLGVRAVRLCLAHPELFKAQLRAIVRVAAEFPLKVMFPMIATLGEWRAARALLEEARREVARSGRPAPARLETGIMVEIPAAALSAARFAEEVDFFSIGTNDLTQYAMAAERGNPRLAALADPLQPAVLELVGRVVAAAHARGRRVGLCGELAGDAAALPLLVGLGLDELSMSPQAVPRAKQRVRTLDAGALRARAVAAAGLDSPEAVRAAWATEE